MIDLVWRGRGLLPRLVMSCSAVLAAVSLVFIVSFVGAELARSAKDHAARLDADLTLLVNVLEGHSIVGDYSGVTELLRSYAQRDGVARVAWVDARGAGVAFEGVSIDRVAPVWFASLAALPPYVATKRIVVGGTDYGEVSLRLSAVSELNRIWNDVAAGTALMLIGALALLLIMLCTVWHGLRPLKTLVSAVGRFGNGEFSVRAAPVGTPEILATIQAFNAMAEQVATGFDLLRESEAKNRRLAMIVEQSSESIMTCDLHGTVTSWNGGAHRLFGWTAEEAIGTSLRALQFGGISEEAHARLLVSVRSGRTSLGEGARVDKTGATLQVSATHAPLLDAGGRVIGAIAVARDITALKRAELALQRANEELEARVDERTAELRRQERLLQAVMNAMPGAVSFQDPQRRFQWFNRKLEAWWNLPASAIQNKTPAELMRAENARTSAPFMERALSGEVVRFEWSYACDDGAVAAIDTTFVPVAAEDAGIAGVAAFSIDITERKHAEATLRHTQAHSRELATMVARSNDSIHVRNLNGEVTFWNRGSERLTGYSSAEAMGQPLRALHLSDKTDVEIAEILKRVHSGTATDFEARRRNKAGHTIDVAIRTQPLFDDGGQLSGEVTVMRDISATKRAEHELRRAKEAAEAANRAKSEFLANMSHEIRTPLNGLLGITDLVLDSELTGGQRADLELVSSCGRTLMAIINDILDFSKIEAGHLRIESVLFDPAACISDSLRVLRPRADAKGLALVCDSSELPSLLIGDPGRIRQIVTNLVGNAIKFTSQGTVCVTAGAELHGDAAARLRVSVHDTGIGIPKDQLSTIFDPFAQADSSTTRNFGGTGLGLTICARLAGLMGGDIAVESVLGEGSRFSFSIGCGVPAGNSAEPATRGASTPKLAPGAKLQGASILVCEDNEVNQLLACRVLERMGHRVRLVANGQEALDALAGESFSLVLMDMQMPGMDGLEATAAWRLRESAGQTRVPVIALTANALTGNREACLTAGMDDFLTKPYTASQLAAVLERWLPGGSGVGTPPAHETSMRSGTLPDVPQASTSSC
jgi:PAS domain S-box-containing protein